MINFDDIYIILSVNIMLLLSVGSVYILLPLFGKKRTILLDIFIGIVFGVVGLLIMNNQFEITDGFLLDTRSVLISMVAAFFGFIPFIFTFLITAALRISQGGMGAFTGVLVIFNTGLIGYLYGKYRLPKFDKLNTSLLIEFYLLGLVIHIVMLLSFFTLPYDTAIYVLGEITVPVLLLYPVATVLIAVVLFKQSLNIKMAQKVDKISKLDYLTGLYNRYYYDQILLDINKEESLPVSLLMGDVNGLKIVNDSFGHNKGDKLLCCIADVLKTHTRESDFLVRWGGDEFVLIMPNTTQLEAAERVIDITNQMRNTKVDNDITPSISLGTTTMTNIGDDFDNVLKRAEDKMYRNKLSIGKSVRSNLISILENTLLERSLETTQHTNNMEKLVLLIAQEMDLSNTQKDELKLIAKLHDIGKIGVSDKILLKKGKLSENEYELIKKHSEIGYRILNSIEELNHIATGVLYHHEKWDGTGYPNGLVADEIPLLSRIISVADAYEVMTNGRIYKDPIPVADAISELQRCKGTQFDPSVVETFIEIMK